MKLFKKLKRARKKRKTIIYVPEENDIENTAKSDAKVVADITAFLYVSQVMKLSKSTLFDWGKRPRMLADQLRFH
mgnify:CR=1 FL=1